MRIAFDSDAPAPGSLPADKIQPENAILRVEISNS